MSVQGTKVNEVKLSLKLMVDSKAKKVVFAEAGKDFVDFLFHILSLPLATVVKLLNNELKIGSLPALYKSVESLKTDYFAQNVNKDTVLLPKLTTTLPLLSLDYVPVTFTQFKCPDHNCISDRSGATCSSLVLRPGYLSHGSCATTMPAVKYSYGKQSASNTHPAGFVKDAVPYMVMDNLEVKPMSMTLIRSLVSDFDYLIEDEVQFGPKEGLALLKASLETTDVLTTVFLECKKKKRPSPGSNVANSEVI